MPNIPQSVCLRERMQMSKSTKSPTDLWWPINEQTLLINGNGQNLKTVIGHKNSKEIDTGAYLLTN